MAKTFEEVTEKIRETLLEEFDRLDELKNKDNLTENDLDYFLAKDRKASIILKTLDMDMRQYHLNQRYSKQIGHKSK